MSVIAIQFSRVIKQLRSIKSNKSPGPEGIPACVLKDLAPQIAPFFEMVFNKSLSEGKVL
jgi:hypothetical protein